MWWHWPAEWWTKEDILYVANSENFYFSLSLKPTNESLDLINMVARNFVKVVLIDYTGKQ